MGKIARQGNSIQDRSVHVEPAVLHSCRYINARWKQFARYPCKAPLSAKPCESSPSFMSRRGVRFDDRLVRNKALVVLSDIKPLSL